MTDTIDKPEEVESTRPPQARTPLSGKTGPMGFGNGPVIAAGVVAGGALFLAGWGITQIVTGDGGLVSALHSSSEVSAPADPGESATHNEQDAQAGQSGQAAQAEDGKVTVTLPDADRNGVPDALEKPAREATGDGKSSGSSGRGDEDRSNQPEPGNGTGGTPGRSKAGRSETQRYIIRPGDTLTGISGDTGVPIDMLVEKNRIKNPNLIYAGASLLIPPTG